MDNEKKNDENLIDENKDLDQENNDIKDDDIIDAEIVDDDYEILDETKIEEDFNEFKDKYQRLLADFTNYKKREEANKADFKRYASSKLIEKLLPVLDNFDRAIKDQDKDDPFVQGIIMTQDELLKVLKNEGLEEIPSDNELFDPNIHQAVLVEESSDVKPDHIIETLQKGYKLDNKVLRPSMVKVAK